MPLSVFCGLPVSGWGCPSIWVPSIWARSDLPVPSCHDEESPGCAQGLSPSSATGGSFAGISASLGSVSSVITSSPGASLSFSAFPFAALSAVAVSSVSSSMYSITGGSGVSSMMHEMSSMNFLNLSLLMNTESAPPSRTPSNMDVLKRSLAIMPSSMEFFETRFRICTGRSCPSLKIRAIRCSNTAGFQGRSRLMSVLATCRFSPVEPASVEMNTRLSGKDLKFSTSSPLCLAGMLPFRYS